MGIVDIYGSGHEAKKGEASRVSEETKKICELTERLIKMEEPLPGPDPLSLIDPAEILRCLQLAREPIELLRNLREQLTKMGPVKIPIFNTRVRRKLIEIKEKKTPTDRIEWHLEFIHFLATVPQRVEENPGRRSIDGNLSEPRKRIRQDSQLKTELNEFFGALYDPDFDLIFEDFAWDVRHDSHNSSFTPAKYLDWAREVMHTVNPEQYGERSQSVGTPIVSQTVPTPLSQHLRRLKTCYLLGLDEMAIVFCRSVLEAALFEALRRRSMLPGDGNTDDIKPYEFARLLGLTNRQMLGGEKKDRALCIGRLAGDILHTGAPPEATEKTEEIIKDTFDIVEELYGD